MELRITTNFPDIQRQLNGLHRDIAEKATARAVNRTMEQARTDMSREIRQEFNITAAKVREKLFLRRAGFKGGQLSIEAALLSQTKNGRRSINLINFQARQNAQGVAVKIKRAGGRKTIKGAFIGNKGRTVFKRRGKSRLPIDPLQTIDVPMMFNTRKINNAVVRKIKEKFPAIWEREVRFYTQRLAR
jgi:hypothetical protein